MLQWLRLLVDRLVYACRPKKSFLLTSIMCQVSRLVAHLAAAGCAGLAWRPCRRGGPARRPPSAGRRPARRPAAAASPAQQARTRVLPRFCHSVRCMVEPEDSGLTAACSSMNSDIDEENTSRPLVGKCTTVSYGSSLSDGLVIKARQWGVLYPVHGMWCRTWRVTQRAFTCSLNDSAG